MLIAEVIFKAEFVFDRKRKYFARMRGSRISVFGAVRALAAPGEHSTARPGMCDAHSRPLTAGAGYAYHTLFDGTYS